MNVPSRTCISLIAAVAMGSAAGAQYADQNQQQADPPSRVARIAYANGNVSLEPAGVDRFSQAELNYPLTAGDRVFADVQAIAELQTSGLAVRMGNGADVTLSSLTDQVAQLGMAQGSIHVRTRSLTDPDGQKAIVEIDTPNGTVVVQSAGDLRVDSYPQDDTTVITVNSGQVEVTAPNVDQLLGPGQSLRLAGSNPVSTQYLRLLPPDSLDQFDQTRDAEYQRATSQHDQYVSPEMIGAAELDQYGDWTPSQDYGQVWYPRAVPAGWTPYHNGHWAWVAPWGWTWIEAEPWGFAPFHYGRWAAFDGRWGWVPGPPPGVLQFAGRERAVRPVYSPALVAFVGGPNFSLSIGFGGAGGGGVAAWFPLGPREAYQPWYHASPAYVNRVNVTNIYNRNSTEVRNTYINRTTNVYNTTNVTNVTYINRPAATTAVTQRDFAAGRRVDAAQPLRIDGNMRRQLDAAPILPHPLVTPTAAMAAPQAAPKALPPNQARPVLETRRGFERAGVDVNRAGAAQPVPQSQPVPQPQAQPVPQAQPQPGTGRVQPFGRQPNSPPQQAPVAAQPSFPQPRDHQPLPGQAAPQRPPAPVASAPVATAPVPTAPRLQPVPQPGPRPQPAPTPPPAPQPRPAPAPTPTPAIQNQIPAGQVPDGFRPRGGPMRSAAPTPEVPPARTNPPAPRPADQPRPLINQTPPQPVQPPFAQQQRAIQRADPGRPLGPQQVDNLRNGRPAGPAQQPEPIPHPSAAPARPQPPVRPQPEAHAAGDNRPNRVSSPQL